MGYYDAIKPIDGVATYDGDFAAWAFEQARRIRALRSNDIDIANIAEEIESLGKGEVSKLESLIEVILLHLLKWDYQPLLRSASWEISVHKCRHQVERHLRENPSLKPVLAAVVTDAYAGARFEAAKETGLPLQLFPAEIPYGWEEISQRQLNRFDPDFLTMRENSRSGDDALPDQTEI